MQRKTLLLRLHHLHFLLAGHGQNKEEIDLLAPRDYCALKHQHQLCPFIPTPITTLVNNQTIRFPGALRPIPAICIILHLLPNILLRTERMSSSSSSSSAASSPSPPGFPPDLVSLFQQHNHGNGTLGQAQSGDQSSMAEGIKEEQQPIHEKLFETIAKLASSIEDGPKELTENDSENDTNNGQPESPECGNQNAPEPQQSQVGIISRMSKNRIPDREKSHAVESSA